MMFGGLTLPLGPAEAVLREVLSPSVERDPCGDMDEVIAEIEAGEATAWLISDDLKVHGAVVTKIVGEARKQLFIWHCAGDGIKDWLRFIALLEAWAKQNGLDSIELHGRPGWQRMLGEGWQRPAVILRKVL